MKRLVAIYLSVLSACVLGFTWMINARPSPEQLILGEWKEMAWEYEKVNWADGDGEATSGKSISAEVKMEAAKNLIIHEAETWSFLPEGKLLLDKGSVKRQVSWHIKGRANVLELKYENGAVERYDLTEVSNDRLVLNFELDSQIKGIAKLTFEKQG